MPPQKLVETLSYSHLELLAAIDDPLKRRFYEVECVRSLWAMRELKRQIASLAYERTGLSRDKMTQVANDQAHAERDAAALAIRDPYVFEFLGLAPDDVMPEGRLERALLNELEAFLLELGRGFCFEARQRRVLIGDEHFFVDLVFYHRILKCHVLIELKSDGFRHEYLGQLNAYVSWYREHEMAAGDNPPVGILLCTEKNHALVKYAIAGMQSKLFVSKYRLALPDEAEMRRFLEARLKDGMVGPASTSERTSSGREKKPVGAKGRAEHRKPRAAKRGAAKPRRKKR